MAPLSAPSHGMGSLHNLLIHSAFAVSPVLCGLASRWYFLASSYRETSGFSALVGMLSVE